MEKRIFQKDETHPLSKPLPGFSGLPCSAGTTTPFPSCLLGRYTRENLSYCPLTPPRNTACYPVMESNTPSNKLVVFQAVVCGSNKQHSNQKPQNTPFPSSSLTPHTEAKPDAIPWGRLSG